MPTRSPLGLDPGAVVKLCGTISIRLSIGLVAEHTLHAKSAHVTALICEDLTPSQVAKLEAAYAAIIQEG